MKDLLGREIERGDLLAIAVSSPEVRHYPWPAVALADVLDVAPFALRIKFRNEKVSETRAEIISETEQVVIVQSAHWQKMS